jgi:hypothetical protein
MQKSLVMMYLLGLLISWNLFSAVSQKRGQDESFLQILSHLKTTNPKQYISRNTPLSKRLPIDNVNYSNVPVVNSYADLMAMFKLIRDTRFLQTKQDLAFERRISWLFPDDGCFARAALAGMKLSDLHYVRPFKIFVFGDLSLQTPYAGSGSVSWWYHVSSVVSYMGSIFVLDPALDTEKPVLVDDWYNKMGDSSEMKVTICNPYSYDPIDDCYIATGASDKEAVSDQMIYLEKEWKRIKLLGFEPSVLLGATPPWNIY